ncbi:MAG: hypothetical protein FWE37_06140 [Spirochaetaceae bacterium]|nr:hypothetical protein [Spirochaetaceae bacterium]
MKKYITVLLALSLVMVACPQPIIAPVNNYGLIFADDDNTPPAVRAIFINERQFNIINHADNVTMTDITASEIADFAEQLPEFKEFLAEMVGDSSFSPAMRAYFEDSVRFMEWFITEPLTIYVFNVTSGELILSYRGSAITFTPDNSGMLLEGSNNDIRRYFDYFTKLSRPPAAELVYPLILNLDRTLFN